MNRITFLTNIANELNIKKGNDESDVSWKCRVIYSAIAKMALASLYDKNEDEKDNSISITYFKRRIEELQKSYTELFPETKIFLQSLNDKFYDLYLENGYIYHSPNWIYPAQKKIIVGDTISFIRGDCFNSNIKMSGMGTYFINSKQISNNDYPEIFENFLFTKNYNEYVNSLIKSAKWETININKNVQYIRLKPPFYNGYWKNSPDKNIISILKIFNTSNRWIYYLYKIENEKCFVSEIPNYSFEKGEYRKIVIGLMLKYNLWEKIFNTQEDGEVVHIELNYLLPPSELKFFKLYSWSEINDISNDLDETLSDSFQNDYKSELFSNLIEENSSFKGVMQKDVFSEFCNILKISGLYKEK